MITTHTAHVTLEARERVRECLDAIREARAWAETCSDALEGNAPEASYSDLQALSHSRLKKVDEMERSFHANLTQLLVGRAANPAHDGALTLYTDGAPLSFFWRHANSTYHGGLIYHANHANGERLPVGTWSIHT